MSCYVLLHKFGHHCHFGPGQRYEFSVHDSFHSFRLDISCFLKPAKQEMRIESQSAQDRGYHIHMYTKHCIINSQWIHQLYPQEMCIVYVYCILFFFACTKSLSESDACSKKLNHGDSVVETLGSDEMVVIVVFWTCHVYITIPNYMYIYIFNMYLYVFIYI